MPRKVACGIKPIRIWRRVLQIYGAANFKDVHPQQWGCFRRKDRKQRRPEVARVAALPFYFTHGFQTLVYGLRTLRMRSRVQRDPASKTYRDLATTPVIDAEGESRTSSRSLTSHSRSSASSKRNWTMPRSTMETAAISATSTACAFSFAVVPTRRRCTAWLLPTR
jgi:hypothetical protein